MSRPVGILLLLFFFLVGVAAAAEPRIVVVLSTPGGWVQLGDVGELPDVAEARAQAEEEIPALRRLVQWHSPHLLDRFLPLLRDPEVAGELWSLTRLGDREQAGILISFMDSWGQDFPLPPGAESFAEVLDIAPRRWSHARPFGKVAIVTLGEQSALTYHCSVFEARADARRTLLHEFGHVADRSLDLSAASGGEEYAYGPDGRHHVQEVTSPSRAFVEGWAQWVAMRGRVATSQPRLPPLVEVESTTSTREAPAYEFVRLGPAQLVANEGSIAAVLATLEEAFGRATLEAAIVGSTRAHRTLADLLEVLVAAVGEEGAARVREALARVPGRAPSGDPWGPLLAGELPCGLGRTSGPWLEEAEVDGCSPGLLRPAPDPRSAEEYWTDQLGGERPAQPFGLLP